MQKSRLLTALQAGEVRRAPNLGSFALCHVEPKCDVTNSPEDAVMSSTQLVDEYLKSAIEDRLSPKEAAATAGVTPPRIYEWMDDGVRGGIKLPSIGLGGRGKRCGKRIILRKWLFAFLAETNESGMVPGGAPA